MKVLVIGGGGREHVIIRKLLESPHVTELIAAPGNGGIAAECETFPVSVSDIPGIVHLAMNESVDYVVVAPEDPLAQGLTDELMRRGIPAFGPSKDAAIIEASKIFSKGLMEKYGIPTAEYRAFSDMRAALDHLDKVGAPIVVKADGLALGKGVFVCETKDEAVAAVRHLMEDEVFGKPGASVVLEERMVGPEVTVLCFTDGKTIVPLPSSRDHKRAYDGDQGPNTGGMGAISPAPGYTPELAARCMREIFLPTMNALNAEGRPFRGVLYFGLMLTEKGPKVVEYNSRFGDPEAQAVLSLLVTDLFDIMRAVTDKRLSDIDIQFSDSAACCLVLASGGYPGAYKSGLPISGLEDAEKAGATVFHAGTKKQGDSYVTSGGRVLGVTCVGETLDAAIRDAYRATESISFEGMAFRRDIGQRDA